MLRTLYLLAFLFFIVDTNSQSDLRFGEWEAHLPYQRGLAVTQSPTKVYYATDWSIMSIEKDDLDSKDFISKVEGLSTLGISDLKYDPFTGQLFVIYQNSDMDILSEEGIVNVADIKNNLGISGDKRINDVHFDQSKDAYLSTGFGVVSYDMEAFEFGFTTQMGIQVFNTSTDNNNMLYAATEDGLYRLDLSQEFNFGDFSNWKLIGEEAGLPFLYEARDIVFFENELFVQIENSVYKSQEGIFTPFYEAEDGYAIVFLNEEGPELMIGLRNDATFKSKIAYVDGNSTISIGAGNCTNLLKAATMEESGRVWYADEWNAFRYTESKTDGCVRINVDSPFSHNVSELRVKDGVLYAASGGVSDGFNFNDTRNGIYVLENGVWTNHNESNNPFLKSVETIAAYRVLPHPDSNTIYIGTFFSGLIKADFQKDEYEIFNNLTSPITGTTGSPGTEKIGGLVFDEDKNLWITVYEGDNPLLALTPEGTFHSMPINTGNRIAEIEIDDFGFKWIQVAGASGGVLLYDDAGTVKDPSDDRQRFFVSSQSNLKTNIINCLKKDLDGDIWVGTAQGPIIFECGGDPFDTENCLGSIRKVLEDSIGAELLVTEDVRSIEVDGANQKWIGTRNGIFVQSPDGRDKVARFTIDNSPLFDNNIIDMAFDPNSGIMYIASDRGIQAFKTTTTEGGRFHKSNTFAFPNPVRPEYEGLIAIKGLARDANVKITDVTGQLVHESFAEGGLATWDGRDYNGRKVASGVYLVFSNSRNTFEDPNTAVTKILIVR